MKEVLQQMVSHQKLRPHSPFVLDVDSEQYQTNIGIIVYCFIILMVTSLALYNGKGQMQFQTVGRIGLDQDVGIGDVKNWILHVNDPLIFLCYLYL